jgi:hypothetical protein
VKRARYYPDRDEWIDPDTGETVDPPESKPGIPGGTPCSGWPMESVGAGVHPDNIKEMHEDSVKRGVPTDFNPKTGDAIFNSREHQLKYLKARGMHNNDDIR